MADQLADLPHSVKASSGQEWQCEICTGSAYIGRSNWKILAPRRRHLVVKNGNFTFLLLELILANATSKSILSM